MATAALPLQENEKSRSTRASGIAANNLGDQGPFQGLPPKAASSLLALGQIVETRAGEPIVEQYHQGSHFFFLLGGRVEFEISVKAAGQLIAVGTALTAWTPIGWSSFRTPHRYATTVRARTDVRLLRFEVDQLEALFATDAILGWYFFRVVSRSAEHLLVEARERLVSSLRASTPISHWGSAFDRARAIARREKPARSETDSRRAGGRIPSEEAMVTNAAPDVIDVLLQSTFFDDLPEELLSVIAESAKVHYFCRGDELMSQGDQALALQILAAGRLRLEYAGASMRTAVLGMVEKPGEMISSAAPGAGDHCDVTVRATRDGSAVEIAREDLEQALRAHPTWACMFQKRVLWALSRQLRATRAHLVSEAFDQEVLAIDNVLEQVRTELRVSSPLHKLPHLLKSAVTLPDAVAIVDRERQSTDRLAAHTAEICNELLAPIRRENRFFSGLQAAYETVVSAPVGEPHEDTRKRSAECFIGVFSEIPYELQGTQFLPQRGGNIFVFNHLKNHEHNTLPNGFQLTLDSHFISSMILHKAYGDPGVRVVRRSRANEYGHQDYYARQGHMSVYTRESDAPAVDRSERFRQFVCVANSHLARGHNLVLAPEGTSSTTEGSPGPFKAGAFRLAAAVDPEPLVVPVVMAHFDRRLTHAKLVALVKPPFLVSERVRDPNDPEQMQSFVDQFRAQYQVWVQEAANLGHRS